ncbi:MAG TPA: GAF domain-containing protein [Anaerolineaceae bacterium]
MASMIDFGLAFLLIATGLVFFGVVFLMLNANLRRRLGVRFAPAGGAVALGGADLVPDHADAVLIVEGGGRIRAINSRARQVFRLQEGEAPNLERLAKKIRPGESLIRLCAAEGQARFVLDGRMVEGTSYLVPNSGQPTAVISLRYPEIATGFSGEGKGLNAQSLQTFNQLTQAMAASLDLGDTLQAILENIEKLIPADLMEISVWDAESDTFIPYRFVGLPGAGQKLELAAERYPAGEGLIGRLAQTRQPVLIPNTEAQSDLRGQMEPFSTAMRAYLALPLIVGSEMIGALVLGSLSAGAFRQDDLALVSLLSGQAAIAIHNALLYHAEQQRTAELSGLAQLAQAFSSVRDPGGLFARLVESIAPLVEAEIVGFLVYNEASRVLEARVPFHGLPDQFVELYHAEVPVNSPAEKILLEQDVLLTEDAADDDKWARLGMDHFARAASLRETVLVPLSTGGHMLGYLQASNHHSGRMPFSQAELHLLMIVANQTASIIENASLVQQSRLRAQRAEALRRITSLVSSSASLEEILQYSVQELARLQHADVGAVFLLDPERTDLTLHQGSVFGARPETFEKLAHLSVDDPQYHFTVTDSQHSLFLAHVAQPERPVIPFYQSILGQWGAQSAIGLPLVVRNEGIGEIWFASRNDAFEQSDVLVAATAAGQLAGAVEQTHLRGQTDESLRRRVDQLTAITRISRELSTSLDLNNLLNLVYDEALRTTRADCGTILLFDMQAGQAAAPRVRFFVGDMPDAELSALEREVIVQDAPRSVLDYERSDALPPHPGIQSALVVPISHKGRIAGLICLHGKSPAQFDDTAVEISQSLAIQAALALQNALAFEDQARQSTLLKRELDILSRLVQVSRLLKPSQSLKPSLLAIAGAIQSATPFQSVVISVFDPQAQALRRLVGVGLPEDVWNDLEAHPQPWRGVQQLLSADYRSGQVYYIPEDRLPAIPEDVHAVSILPPLENHALDAWQPGDMLLIPLHDSEQNPLGLISVDAPQDNRRPDKPTFEALEVFGAQASLMIESHLRVGRLEDQMSDLEREKKRLEQSAAQGQANLPVMLHKDLEQSMALRGLNRRIERIRASLEIAALANQQDDESAVLHTLAGELLTRFAMQVALVAEKTAVGLRLLEVIGTLPPGANPEALLGQRNPLRQLLQRQTHTAQPDPAGLLLVANLDGLAEWQNMTLLNVLGARSMIGMALDAGQERVLGVLVLGQRSLPAFLDEDWRVFGQLAHQVSMGIQNLALLNETRRRLQEVNLLLDFSRKLGSLTPQDILGTLIESVRQALPSIHAGWVGLWEEKEHALIPQAAVGYVSKPDILGIRYAHTARPGSEDDTLIPLPLKVFRSGQPERISEVDFASQYRLGAGDLLHYRKASSGRLPVSVLLVPLRIGENTLGVMFLENFDTPGAFSQEDEALAASFTGQAAMALENARLFQASEQRANQLQALTKVAGTITSSLQRNALIATLLDQLKVVVPYDTATLWLRSGETLSVAEATGFADNESRLNLSVDVQDSALFKAMIRTGAPIIVSDVRSDTRFPALLEPDYLSWLGIPLVYKSELTGLIALEKRETDFFTRDYVAAATAFASQAAVSLENARLYEESTRRASELDDRSQRMALLNRLSGELGASFDTDYIFHLAAQELRDALDASGVAVVMIEPDNKYVVQGEVPARDETAPLVLPDSPLFERLSDSHGIFQTSDAAAESELLSLWRGFLRVRGGRSLMVVPLVSGSVLLGWFLIYGSKAQRYGPAEIELSRTMCNQSAIAIQNARLFAETLHLTSDLEQRVEERTREVVKEHHNSQTLLHIITELSASLDMGLVLNRTLTVLNESLGSEESLIILSQERIPPYRAGQPLARLSDGTAAVERQIARWVVRSRQPVLMGRVQEDGRWEIAPATTPAYQSVLAVPLVMGEEVLGALLLFHRSAAFFEQSQMGLMEATARQISIALNNAELFNLIRDQSEHLGSMLRDQQIEASRSRAILEAVADGVVVTDSQTRVTLFNASAERILNLKSHLLMGKSLDEFSGMFGKAAIDWLATIRGWSEDPSLSLNAETFAEHLALDNGHNISVHLAPVFWRHEFLGTVSIFRDITHEVQVDRLKSEFVANVSHELRTPMTSIKGYVEIMLMGASGELTPQQTHFLSIVKSNTERLMVLVNDLLDISRIEAGRVSLDFKPLDVRAIAEDVIAEFQRRSRDEKRAMQFDLQVQPDLPRALGDAERVRQVIASLVSNGYTYTPENGGVAIGIHRVDHEIQIDVRDTGIGIELEAQHRIFERFYRGEDPLVLASAGTGLGLAIAKALIEMHHGRIWFASSGVRGEGSLFSVTLPVSAGQE